MPLTSRQGESSGGFEQSTSQAGSMQLVVQDFPVAVPTTLSASATWNSGLLFSDGYPRICVGLLMDHAGTLNVHRFVDLAGTIERTVSTAAIVASTVLILDVSDLLPFLTYSVEIVNAAGGVGTINKLSVFLMN